jgi:putative chitinase
VANSRRAGPWDHFARLTSARTPGPLGFHDQGDPNIATLLGDTPGPLGFADYADPSLPRLWNCLTGIGINGAGIAISLSANGHVPGADGPAGKLTGDQLAAIFRKAEPDYLKKVADELNHDLATYGLDTVLRRSHFFGQILQECGSSLKAPSENLHYSPQSLKDHFAYYKRHPAEAVADGYEPDPSTGRAKLDPKTHRPVKAADPEAIANKAYANRNGNGDVASKDGWRYRGRGFIQIPGRGNYSATTRQYRKLYSDEGIDFVKEPDRMSEFPYTLRSAVCFWISHGLEHLADSGSTDADINRVTAVVNKKTDSYDKRRANFRLAYHVFSL